MTAREELSSLQVKIIFFSLIIASIENQLMELSKLVPEWITIQDFKAVKLVRIQKSVDLSRIHQMLQERVAESS